MNCFHPVRHQLHYKAYLKPSGVLTKPLQVKFSPNSEFPKQLERVHFYNSVVCPDQASLINIQIIHLSRPLLGAVSVTASEATLH